MRPDKDTDPATLRRLLDTLWKSLEKKDVNQFFAWPVTDAIAPAYSIIIKDPMDFSTMKKKIDSGDYESVAQFKVSFMGTLFYVFRPKQINC